MSEPHSFATAQIHGGEIPDAAHGSRVTPIHLSAGFAFDDFEQARARFAGEDDGYLYSRYGNPTLAQVERRIAALEGADEAILVGSGQAAVTVALLGLLRAGDHLLAASTVYEGTRGLLTENFSRFGIEVDFVDDPSDLDAWRRGIRPITRALYGEPIANPRTQLLDLAPLADLAHGHGIPLVVDNTLGTPYLLRPIEHGADVVIHSTSKYLTGTGSALGGAIAIASAFDPDYARFTRETIASRLGPVLSPLNAFLLLQGLETLALRVERHSASALELARWLETRPEVASVDYAGLASHPSHVLAERYLPRGAGGVLSFTLRGGEAAAREFVDAVRLVSRMTHLGDVRTMLLHPASTSHARRSAAERAAAGIGPGLLRLAVGLEGVADLRADLELGLRAARPAGSARVVHFPDPSLPVAAVH
ncbi:MAG: O-acetylhomoserine aminocarboxypropyltransferase/cysteine synthase [Micrococcales bacterium]|nr:O-acetylhomoserine aminocarboxypropyltransferase/cysteine synthase [Micrococcales bacterium]